MTPQEIFEDRLDREMATYHDEDSILESGLTFMALLSILAVAIALGVTAYIYFS